MLDAFAMDHRADDVAAAAEALAPLVAHLDIGHVAHEFWYAYFRIRIDAGLPVDGAPCPDELCAGGARRAIMRVTDRDRKKAGGGAAPRYPWAESEWAARAVATAWARPRAASPGSRPPGPPRGGGEPVPGRTGSSGGAPPTVEPEATTE